MDRLLLRRGYLEVVLSLLTFTRQKGLYYLLTSPLIHRTLATKQRTSIMSRAGVVPLAQVLAKVLRNWVTRWNFILTLLRLPQGKSQVRRERCLPRRRPLTRLTVPPRT